MDNVRVGRILRALRRRLLLTQAALGEKAVLSQQTISLVERGHGAKLAGDTMRRLFAAVDASWEPHVSWRGGEVDRLLDEDHAALVSETVRRLRALGWEVLVEVTYSEYGERGSIDVMAARREALAVVSAEIKSDFVTADATVRKADEKDRLVRRVLCRDRFGFRPMHVGRLLVLPADDRSRGRIRRAAGILDAAFPSRGAKVRSWLRRPSGDVSGLLFFALTNGRSATRRGGGRFRVRRPRAARQRA